MVGSLFMGKRPLAKEAVLILCIQFWAWFRNGDRHLAGVHFLRPNRYSVRSQSPFLNQAQFWAMRNALKLRLAALKHFHVPRQYKIALETSVLTRLSEGIQQYARAGSAYAESQPSPASSCLEDAIRPRPIEEGQVRRIGCKSRWTNRNQGDRNSSPKRSVSYNLRGQKLVHSRYWNTACDGC